MGRSLYAKAREQSLGQLLRKGPRFVYKQIWHWLLARYYSHRLHADLAHREQRRQAAIDRLADAETILFCCHGNICRGPFAERYARQRLHALDISDLTLVSAGFTDLTDPTAPPDARNTAAQYGVTLDDHRASQATDECIDRADLVLLMDYRNYHNFTRRFPEAASRTFLLRLFAADERMQIADPYNDGPAAFERTYERIRLCVENLVQAYQLCHADRSSSTGDAGN